MIMGLHARTEVGGPSATWEEAAQDVIDLYHAFKAAQDEVTKIATLRINADYAFADIEDARRYERAIAFREDIESDMRNAAYSLIERHSFPEKVFIRVGEHALRVSHPNSRAPESTFIFVEPWSRAREKTPKRR